MSRAGFMGLLSGLIFVAPAFGGAVFVQGLVPDWNQPLREGAGAPVPPPPGWVAWCAPTSGSNLAGHWDDVRGVPVADGAAHPLSNPPLFGAGASWKDYLADGFARPAKNAAPPAAATDVGWYMDTNNSGQNLGNAPHTGTFLKDVHLGLLAYLNTIGAAWTTGTQGKNWAGGLNSAGAPAIVHPNAAAAFAEIVNEVNANRTMIISWSHWNILPTPWVLAPNPAAVDESQFGGTFYTFGNFAADPWGNGEAWNNYDNLMSIGHDVTAVGYILAGDEDDPEGLVNPTDWVIVHDNVPVGPPGTPRNVIVPLNWLFWTGNTNAVPEPATLAVLTLGGLALLRRRRRT